MIHAVRQYKWLLLLVAISGLALLSFQVLNVDAQTPTNGLSGYAWSTNFGYIKMSGSASNGAYGVRADSNGVLSGLAWVSATDPDATPADTDSVGWLSFNAADTNNSADPCPSAPCQATLNTSTGQVSGWARFLRGNQIDGGGWVHLRGANYGVQVSGCQWSGLAYNGGNDDRGGGWIKFQGATTGGSAYGVTGSGTTCLASFAYSVVAEDPVTVTRPASGSLSRPVNITLTRTGGSAGEVVSVYDVTISGTSGVTPGWSTASCQVNPSCTTSINISVPSTANTTNSPYTVTVRTRSATGVLGSDTFTLNIQAATAFDFDVSSNQNVLRYTAPGTQNATITVTRTAGTPASVSLSSVITSGGPSGSVVPSGITTTFTPPACNPAAPAYSCPSIMAVAVTSAVANGPYNVRVWGTSGSVRDYVDVQLCVSFCSAFNYTVDAPNTATVITVPTSGSTLRDIPILITRTASTLNETVRITSVLFSDGRTLPSTISAAAMIGQSCGPAPSCPITRALQIFPGAPVGTHTLRVNTEASGGRTANDTFILTIDPAPSPTVNYTVAPSNPPTVTAYQSPYRSNVRFTWLAPMTAIERIRFNDVSFASAIATAGIAAPFTTTNCLPVLSSGVYTCVLPLDVTVGANVPDGTYTGAVCGRSVGNTAAGVASTNTRKCGNFTITVDVNNPLADLDGRKTGDIAYVDGPITVPSGSTVDLQWGSIDAETCQLSSGGVDLGTPGQGGNYTSGSLTTNTTYTLTCDNANGVDTDTFVVNVGAVVANPITADLQVKLSTAPDSSYSNGPVRVLYGRQATQRWVVRNSDGTVNTTATCYLRSDIGLNANMGTTRVRTSGALNRDFTYTVGCTATSGEVAPPDSVAVDVYSAIDLTGPGGCTTNCTADQSETVTVDWDYDGDATECTLSGTGIPSTTVGTSGNYDVDLPSTGGNATYTVSCTGPNTGNVNDTVNFTLNVVQCFENLNYSGSTEPTAAFILQDSNSQNTFILNGKLDLLGFNPANLRLHFVEEVCPPAGVPNTGLDPDMQCPTQSNRRPLISIANQTPQINSDGTFRVTLTLDNAEEQPVGEFWLQLLAEDGVGSCGDHWMWVRSYLVDERENLGEI